ncbi:hypothetical protein [Nocardiopsis coralli]|nr:hypothetical protein [Nocardiopsis coralli]
MLDTKKVAQEISEEKEVRFFLSPVRSRVRPGWTVVLPLDG